MKTTTAAQLVAIGRLVVDKEAPVEQTQKLLDLGLLSDLFDANLDGIDRDSFRKLCGLVALSTPVASDEYSILIVDFGLTLSQMIAVGKYDWVNSDITEQRYPVCPKGQMPEKVEYEYMLDYPNRNISTDAELKRTAAIDKDNPWQAAETPQLLAYGAVHPEDQRQFPIIGLGSVASVDDDRDCPYLDSSASERGLRLGWFGGGWGARCRFLLVRRKKVSVTSVS